MTTKQMQVAQDQKFIAAYKQYFGTSTKITVGQTQYAPAQIISMVQSRVNAEAKVETTRGEYSQAVAEAKATIANTDPLYDSLKQAILVLYQGKTAILSAFGLSARKVPGPKTVAVKQAAVDQMLATREARHTMGKRQRAKVKGVVTGAPSGATAAPPATATSETVATGVSPAVITTPVVTGAGTPSGTGH